jgi:glycosyltransferase involved in cell wall biosynthesis
MPALCLNIAYLTAEYPKVSHTFIRREILELERRGHRILRMAIRCAGDAIADESDQIENDRTIHFMALPKRQIFMATIRTMVTRPLRWLSALRIAVSMSHASERGLLRHLAYLLEASVFLQILLKNQIQHVHVHFGTNAAAVARLIHHLGGPGYSMTVHGSAEFDAPLGFSLSEKAQDAKFIIAISDFCYAQLCRWLAPNQWSKIHIVHCSVGEEYFVPGTPIEETAPILLSIGRLCAEKGYTLLLEAISKVLANGLDLQLVLAGDGELRPLIEERIEEFGLSKNVRITGWLDEEQIRAELRQCRILVQPSFAEGLPVVIMEAFAMCRPVISTYVGGIPELVLQGENGWLVPAGNVDDLATAIQEALLTPLQQLGKMGAAGRDRAQIRHDLKKETAALEKLLISVATKSGAI